MQVPGDTPPQDATSCCKAEVSDQIWWKEEEDHRFYIYLYMYRHEHMDKCGKLLACALRAQQEIMELTSSSGSKVSLSSAIEDTFRWDYLLLYNLGAESVKLNPSQLQRKFH